MTWGFFKEVQKWERAGLVTIAAEEVLSPNKSFDWDDWFARTQRGELKRIHIEATPRGLELATLTEKTEDSGISAVGGFLGGRCFHQIVEEIVSDEEVEVRTEQYRVIQAKVRREPEELGELLESGTPPGVRENRGEFKVRLLLKLDVFEGKWNFSGIDMAPLSRDFQTRDALPPS